jgi:hypothetical protein
MGPVGRGEVMAEAYEEVREFVRRALAASQGDWNAAERLCHEWLDRDAALKGQIARICLEWVLRNAITAEGRRQQQREAEQLREARAAEERERETRQTVEQLLEDLRGPEEGRQQAPS